jgi:hypothetical protein
MGRRICLGGESVGSTDGTKGEERASGEKASKDKLRLDHEVRNVQEGVEKVGGKQAKGEEDHGTPFADFASDGAAVGSGVVGADNGGNSGAADGFEEGREPEEDEEGQDSTAERHKQAAQRESEARNEHKWHLSAIGHQAAQVQDEEHTEARDGQLQRHLPIEAAFCL